MQATIINSTHSCIPHHSQVPSCAPPTTIAFKTCAVAANSWRRSSQYCAAAADRLLLLLLLLIKGVLASLPNSCFTQSSIAAAHCAVVAASVARYWPALRQPLACRIDATAASTRPPTTAAAGAGRCCCCCNLTVCAATFTVLWLIHPWQSCSKPGGNSTLSCGLPGTTKPYCSISCLHTHA